MSWGSMPILLTRVAAQAKVCNSHSPVSYRQVKSSRYSSLRQLADGSSSEPKVSISRATQLDNDDAPWKNSPYLRRSF